MKVYYNSACPVCDAGIENQRCRMTAQGAEGVEWLDVHTEPGRVTEVDADLPDVRERLHVKTADGVVHVGVDALSALFARTRGQRWLAKVLGLPVIRPLGALAYNCFARCLYLWNVSRRRW